ncbi:hypothetical protein Tco_0042148, partial [Tanacetum coccineum]
MSRCSYTVVAAAALVVFAALHQKHIRDHEFSMYYDIRRHNNYIEHDTNSALTSNELDIASTSNKPAEDVGPTKDDLEGLFEMANEELFP